MRVDTFKCDVCGIQKGETNHWYSLEKTVKNDNARLELLAAVFTDPAYMHLCSDACVIKAVQQWLSAQKEASQPGGDNNVG